MDSEPTLYGIWCRDTFGPVRSGNPEFDSKYEHWCWDGNGRIYFFLYRHEALAHGRWFSASQGENRHKYFLARLTHEGLPIILLEIVNDKLTAED